MSDITRKLKGPRSAAPALLVDDLKRRAAEQDLMDVAYAPLDSPVGPLVVAATRRGLVRISYVYEDPEFVVEDLAARISPRVLEAPERLDDVRRELDEYFDGTRTNFDIAIDWRLTAGFTRKVLRATARVPYGSTSTYREVAGKAGSPRGSRAAGNALGSNPIPIVVPCHRILHSGGGMGGYTGGLDKKIYLLNLEGAI
ncbi:MAG: methylated-DNA-[protein]-cysteine S-methyltransferase [Actinomycetota bacterium]|jgi:methylated-DNA-[protein]-cysteine S-methyltransferase|nr:methylated-DNA-[protein]-cysteine S-methyltransferase [Actinomycetota bacterium]MEA2486892.1 methylated-DNA-[protein]-cysteine S-methyltransferase [Actinomycetota bacterium]